MRSMPRIVTAKKPNNAHAPIPDLHFFHDLQVSLSLPHAKVPPGYSPLVYLSTRCPRAVYFSGVPAGHCVTVGLPRGKCSGAVVSARLSRGADCRMVSAGGARPAHCGPMGVSATAGA